MCGAICDSLAERGQMIIETVLGLTCLVVSLFPLSPAVCAGLMSLPQFRLQYT